MMSYRLFFSFCITITSCHFALADPLLLRVDQYGQQTLDKKGSQQALNLLVNWLNNNGERYFKAHAEGDNNWDVYTISDMELANPQKRLGLRRKAWLRKIIDKERHANPIISVKLDTISDVLFIKIPQPNGAIAVKCHLKPSI
jgi:hypothetical protein